MILTLEVSINLLGFKASESLDDNHFFATFLASLAFGAVLVSVDFAIVLASLAAFSGVGLAIVALGAAFGLSEKKSGFIKLLSIGMLGTFTCSTLGSVAFVKIIDGSSLAAVSGLSIR